ncbi:hypothetical protein BDB00DRAFT_173553 [Zychaea mexicana]|uniref:uncharacterized protein n=1 Tax=Zychaea mexicana TaxID=64656 RepID=UPI0022FF0F54|nr:uncharacterized protein BDB00DRAFT_173553 [Zychaea mexicana]KAI9479594.1 hypothetical protein BDB00DRAFT_173553 [Zychaea mexicana]
MQRAFTLSHERFVLDIDPTRRHIKGSAELTIQPLQKRLSNIRINCRQCKITSVEVNEQRVRHSYADPVSELTLGENTTVAHHHVYKSKYLNALREADEGELLIPIPDSCIKQISESEARLVTNDVYMHDTMTTLHDDTVIADKTNDPLPSTPTYAPITVRVEYTLENPRTGVIFVDPDEIVAPYRYHHLYTINQPLPGATRSWLPCIDRIHDRCTWEMDFIVPNKLGSLPYKNDGEDISEDEYPAMVVCSGDMVEQVVHPLDVSRKIVRYNLSIPTAAPFIGFAVGPFEMIKLTPAQLQEEVLTGADLDENQQQSLMAEINMMANIYAFALPGQREDLTVSCSFLMHAMHFYAQEYGSYPFTDYKLVFVEDAWSETSSSASLTIYSSRLLHPPDIIDQTYNTRRVLSLALARQWFGIHIVQKSWPDAWLVYGLSNLMGAYFIKRHLGNSEFRLRMKRDMELCCTLDVNRPPLYNPALPSPLDPEDLEFIDLKAPLVLYMLDRRICKAGTTLGLARVISKLLVSAISGELVHNALSTHNFLKLCRKLSGVDTKTFADQWIYRSGCPKFTFSFHFNRKKMVVEFYMSQENSNACLGSSKHNPPSTDMNVEGANGVNGGNGSIDYQDLVTPLFTGNLTVRIHEADGTPYEHILDIQSAKHKFEVQFNTKYKRIRRNTKRFLAKQAAAAAAVAEEDADKEDGEGGTTNVLGIIPALGLGMPVFEDPKQREIWKVVEWGQDEEDTSGAASAMFDWIRLDADFEWICTIDFKQPDYMWAGQLTKDRDVVAQYEAIEALKNMPSLPTSTSLLRALLDSKCFYKIRMESAYALAKCGGGDNDWVGLHQLYKMFQGRYCFPPAGSPSDPEDPLTWTHAIPKPNNFSTLPDYFVQKGLVIAFSQVRDENGVTPIKVRQLLLDLLKYNDNIGNEFSDSYYIATIISALGDAFIPMRDTSNPDSMQIDDDEGEQLLAAAVSEIERFRTLDCVIPTYHNIVTVSCIKALTNLMLNGVLEPSLNHFLQYTRYGNYLGIRLCAFDSLFVLCGLTENTLTEYFLNVIKDDPCPYVSHYVARAMLAWLGPAMRDKQEVTQSRFVEEFAEEEGRGSLLEERQLSQKANENEDEVYIENLRRQFEDNMELQENIWRLLNSTESASLDHSVRKSLLQFCEYMYKPVDVGIKVTIRMPSLVQDIAEDVSEPAMPSPPVLKISKSKHEKHDKINKHEKHEKHDKREKADKHEKYRAQKGTAKENGEAPARPEKRPSLLENTVAPTHKENKQQQKKLRSPPEVPATVAQPAPPPVAPISIPSPQPVSTAAPTPIPEPEPATATVGAASQQPPPSAAADNKQIPLAVPRITSKKPDGMTVSDFKKCRRILGKIQRHKSALAFLQPVDEELDGAPQYYKIIKKPMDIGTIRTKLEKGEYTTYQQLDDDIRLMLNNCFAYNGPGTFVHNEAFNLEQVLEKELEVIRKKEEEKRREHEQRRAEQLASEKKPEKGTNETAIVSPLTATKANTPSAQKPSPPAPVLSPQQPRTSTPISTTTPSTPASVPSSSAHTPSPAPRPSQPIGATASPTAAPSASIPKAAERKPEREKTFREKCATVLAKTMENRHAFEFLRPVDPIRQGIPQYLTIIKKPIDLGTIKGKLKTNKYTSAQEFDEDVRLMLRNCFAFNKPNTYVHEEGRQLEEVYNREWANVFGGAVRKPSSPVVTKEKPAPAPESVKAPVVATNGDVSTPITARTPPHPQQSPVQQAPKKSTSKPGTSASTSAQAVPKSSSVSPAQPKHRKQGGSHGANGSSTAKSAHERQRIRDRMDDDNIRRCDQVLKKIWNHPASQQFYEPVDVEGLNLPQYYDIVKRPMDLSSVRRNLEGEEFSTIWEFERDIRQVFWNCYLYNDPNAWITQQARELEGAFNKVWCAEFGDPNRLQGENLKLVRKVVTKLSMHDAAAFFNEPVDLDSLPDYGRVVKTPMDLRTIWEKVESGKYTNLPDVDSDIRLVFTNCFTYNKVGTFAYDQGKRLEKYYNSNIGKELRHRVKEASPAARATTPTTTTPTPSSTKHNTATPKPRSSASPAPTSVSPKSFTSKQQQHGSSNNATIPSPKQTNIDKRSPSITMKPPHTTTAAKTPTIEATVPSASATPTTKASPAKTPKPSKETHNHPKAEAQAAKHHPSPPSTPRKLPTELTKKITSLLGKLKNHIASMAFLQPVDPVALGVPHYPAIIKKPMDLSTVEKKLKDGEYKSVKDFETDVRLIFTNCYTFNGFEHPVSQNAMVLEKIVNKEVPALRKKEQELLQAPTSGGGGSSSSKASSGGGGGASQSKKTPKKTIKQSSATQGPTAAAKAELRKYKAVLDKLQSHPSYFAFSAPVDPVLLQIPTYFDVIKNPMDLGTARKKLEKNEYLDASALLKDVQQVFINCFLFNPADDVVYEMGRKVESEFNELCAAKGLKGIPISNPVKPPIPTSFDSQLQQDQDPMATYEQQPASFGEPMSFHQQHEQQQFGYDLPYDQSGLGYDQSVSFEQPDFTAGIPLEIDPMGSHKRGLDDYVDGGDAQDYDLDHSDEFLFGKKRRVM